MPTVFAGGLAEFAPALDAGVVPGFVLGALPVLEPDWLMDAVPAVVPDCAEAFPEMLPAVF